MNFGVNADEFQKDFPEFNKHNPQEMEILGREIDKKYMTYAYIKSENSKITEFDPFKNIYVILVSFINNILVKFEMYGVISLKILGYGSLLLVKGHLNKHC